MRRLPALAAGTGRWVLPVADSSVAALVGVLLDGGESASAAALGTLLAGDPPLALWSVCVRGQQEDFQPGCLDDVAHWLAEHGPLVLQWGADDGVETGAAWASREEVYADHVAASVETADLAARLAAADGEEAVAKASLLGLLHNASDWLAAVGDPADQPDSTCLPTWLTDPSPASAAVALARAILAGEAPESEQADIDPDPSRRRAVETRRRWLAPADGLAGRLPALAAKLARLRELEDRFQETLEREKLEAMAEFAAGAGHEINNPLTVIAGRAQLFLREEKDPERRRALALMNSQAMRVYEMIADMMLFARPPKPEPETLDVLELVDGLIEEFSPHAARQETTLQRTSPNGPNDPGNSDAPVRIEADGLQLTVALRAVCQNALEAIGGGGKIEIRIEPGDREVRIHVTDDGPGITPQQRRHLFDPYYSARQAGRGLGLGLSKCWRIVTNHGGRIDVASRPGQGAAFTITLPRTQ